MRKDDYFFVVGIIRRENCKKPGRYDPLSLYLNDPILNKSIEVIK